VESATTQKLSTISVIQIELVLRTEGLESANHQASVQSLGGQIWPQNRPQDFTNYENLELRKQSSLQSVELTAQHDSNRHLLLGDAAGITLPSASF
jgi:hypothetical protein